jgi:hypothetical protein
MALLTPEVQTFIVAEFARAKKGGQIVKSVKKEFNLDIDRQQVWHYHPENPKLAKQWKDLYRDVRDRFTTDVITAVGGFKSFRIEELTELYWAAKESGNSVHAAELLKQMAQEKGEVFTNKRTVNVNPREALAEMLGVSPEDLPENAGK